MNSIVDIKDREKIAKEIAKTSESIRKKYHALKTGKMDEDVALERHFRPIVEPLKQIAGRTADMESNIGVKTEAIGTSTEARGIKPEEKEKKLKPEEKEKKLKRKAKWKLADMSWDYSDTPTLALPKWRRLNDPPPNSPPPPVIFTSTTQYEQPLEAPPTVTLHTDEDTVFETPDEPFATSVRRRLQTSKGQEMLRDHFGPLGQKYMGAVLSGDGKDSIMDYVYGVRVSNDGAMLGDKRIDVDRNDDIIIDETRYKGTSGLYELIFKRIPDDTVYTEADIHKYKSILLATNAHRRGYSSQNPILGNRGHKYKHIIGPLVSHVSRSKAVGKGLPQAMTLLNNNEIDYVHWDDPNELVDRLRLLEASRQAGNNAHDNEILSIIEELREVGLIIN